MKVLCEWRACGCVCVEMVANVGRMPSNGEYTKDVCMAKTSYVDDNGDSWGWRKENERRRKKEKKWWDKTRWKEIPIDWHGNMCGSFNIGKWIRKHVVLWPLGVGWAILCDACTMYVLHIAEAMATTANSNGRGKLSIYMRARWYGLRKVLHTEPVTDGRLTVDTQNLLGDAPQWTMYTVHTLVPL